MTPILKILHLEDNEYDAELIKSALKSGPIESDITHVKDREGFINTLQKEKFDIILCDYSLPSFTGMEAMIMAKEIYPETPFIFISGSIGEERAIELLKKGATDYLIKDSPARLISAITRALQEVKERKNLREARELLLRSEEQYRNIFENSQVGIYRTTPSGEILAANPALINMLGYSSFEEISKIKLNNEVKWNEYLRDDFIQQIESNGEVHAFESIWRRKDGKSIYILENAKVIRDKNGESIYYEGTAQDITERKIAQQQIEKNAKLLAESQAIAKLGTWEVNFVEKTDIWSEEFYKLLGYEPFAVTPSQELFLNHIHPGDRDAMKKHISGIIKHAGSFVSEQRIIRTDGEVRIHIGKGIVEVDKSGKPIRMYGIVQDVTELKVAEREIIEAKEKAEESDKLKSEFLAQMSHEIRTPLNAISNIAQLLKEDLKDNVNEDTTALFNSIDSAVKRLIRTVETILNMSSLQAGTQVETNLSKFNLNLLISNIVDEFKSYAASQKLFLEHNSSLFKPMVIDDEYIISQIIRLLLDNAIKFTNEGGVKIEVYEDENSKKIIKVIDTGIGIAKEFWPQIFTPFTQESSGFTRRYEGSGLGLALVKRYVDIIGASIKFESEKGKGSVFTICLKDRL
jgi:PAS domain S-box-containing protein